MNAARRLSDTSGGRLNVVSSVGTFINASLTAWTVTLPCNADWREALPRSAGFQTVRPSCSSVRVNEEFRELVLRSPADMMWWNPQADYH